MFKKLDNKFKEFYDEEIRDTQYILQSIMLSGRTLKEEDINNFWATFKTAQKEAFIAGAMAILD